jgi:hypothetical protein
VLDAAAWQATLLDKCALLFTALLTYYVARSDPAASTWRDQAILLTLTVLAINTKESRVGLRPVGSVAVLAALR